LGHLEKLLSLVQSKRKKKGAQGLGGGKPSFLNSRLQEKGRSKKCDAALEKKGARKPIDLTSRKKVGNSNLSKNALQLRGSYSSAEVGGGHEAFKTQRPAPELKKPITLW